MLKLFNINNAENKKVVLFKNGTYRNCQYMYLKIYKKNIICYKWN